MFSRVVETLSLDLQQWIVKGEPTTWKPLIRQYAEQEHLTQDEGFELRDTLATLRLYCHSKFHQTCKGCWGRGHHVGTTEAYLKDVKKAFKQETSMSYASLKDATVRKAYLKKPVTGPLVRAGYKDYQHYHACSYWFEHCFDEMGPATNRNGPWGRFSALMNRDLLSKFWVPEKNPTRIRGQPALNPAKFRIKYLLPQGRTHFVPLLYLQGNFKRDQQSRDPKNPNFVMLDSEYRTVVRRAIAAN
jgi:hypothetical protein